MHKYILTVGFFDKKEEKQLIPSEKIKSIIADTLINSYNIDGFTMTDCSGCYRMKKTGNIVLEPSVRIDILTDDRIDEKIMLIIADLKDAINQESILHEYLELYAAF